VRGEDRLAIAAGRACGKGARTDQAQGRKTSNEKKKTVNRALRGEAREKGGGRFRRVPATGGKSHVYARQGGFCLVRSSKPAGIGRRKLKKRGREK